MKNSLVPRFVLFALLLIVFTAVAGNGLSYKFFSKELNENSRVGLLELARVSANDIENEISLRSNFLREISILPVVANFTTNTDLNDLKAFFRHENEVFQEIELILANGQVILDYEKQDIEPLADTTRKDKKFNDSLNDPSHVYWEIIPEKVHAGVPVVALYLGLRKPNEPTAWAVLRAESFLTTFTQHVNSVNNDNGSVLLINKINNILLPLAVEPGVLNKSELNSAITEMANSKTTEIIQTAGNDNNPFLFVKADLANSNWEIVSILTEDSFYAVQDKAIRVLVITTFIITLIGGFIAFLLGRNIVKPLQLMDYKFKNAATGEFEKIGHARAPGEIKTVIASYNQMVEKLESALYSQNYLDRVFSSIQEGILVINLDGTIEKANEAVCLILGYSQKELLEKTYHGLLPETDEGWLESLTRGKKNKPASLRDFKTASGQTITTQFTWASFDDQNGRASGIVCILRKKPVNH